MQVVALKTGFHGGYRRRVGAIFDMDVKADKLPKWVKAAADPIVAQREAEAAKKAELDKQTAGALAASGGKSAKAKNEAMARSLAG